jgi:hypothetical protein
MNYKLSPSFATESRNLPLTPKVITEHLAGNIHAGLYPLLRDDSCRLIVCDFDGPGWALDALAYINSAQSLGISPALERSRSGDGAQVSSNSSYTRVF